MAFGIIVLSACSDSSYHREKIAEPAVELVTGNEELESGEYIIILVENAEIEHAIDNLQEYDAHVIKDLNRGRYLVGLKIDPGIEQLKIHIRDSLFINQIQPNFSYTTQ